MSIKFNIELFNAERENGRIVRHWRKTNEEIMQLTALAMSIAIGKITQYPPPAPRNQPPEPWWERGRGLHSGGGIAQDSYMLGHEGEEANDNWYFPAQIHADGVVVEAQMEPEAPYLAYVLGSDTQASWHQGRWLTINDAANFANNYINEEGRAALIKRLEYAWEEESMR